MTPRITPTGACQDLEEPVPIAEKQNNDRKV